MGSPSQVVKYDRTLFEAEHDLFRESYRAFLDRHVAPFHEQWEKDKIVDRGIWLEAGKQGFLGMAVPEEYGGGGNPDFRYNVIINEETVAGRYSGIGFGLHNDVVLPYLLRLANEEQKQRWLPKFCTGEMITAIAMTEPGTGSDLQSIKTTAIRDGGYYVLNGQKTFITNGIHSDLVIVAAKTDPEQGAGGLSLIAVERDTPGFERGRNLDKIGMHAQDTSELSFTDVAVPAANLLGEEGGGFIALMQNLPRERIAIGGTALAGAEKVFADTLAYCQQRQAFGRPIGSFQHNRFVLAEISTELEIARTYVDQCVADFVAERFESTPVFAAYDVAIREDSVFEGVEADGGFPFGGAGSGGTLSVKAVGLDLFVGCRTIREKPVARADPCKQKNQRTSENSSFVLLDLADKIFRA